MNPRNYGVIVLLGIIPPQSINNLTVDLWVLHSKMITAEDVPVLKGSGGVDIGTMLWVLSRGYYEDCLPTLPQTPVSGDRLLCQESSLPRLVEICSAVTY